MQQIGKMSVGPQGDRDLVFTRPFKAPRSRVWDAFTIPSLVQQWLGAMPGWTFPVCEIDLRVGGTYRYVWRNADGSEMGMTGTYRELVKPERIVSTELFDEAWYPGDALVTTAFAEANGTTMMTMTIRYDSTATRDDVLAGPAAGGVAVSFDALETFLGK